ncbi:hypothetical protein PRVXT_002155 [Proteinivorax tanatarense]|uniref:Uncharacterized protein n=1 Tax=Proteinivorax tanatarense TaxID=1260629 RepID=A0AAU7VJB8_9FIRM
MDAKAYSIKLASYTEGKGTFLMRFFSYQEVDHKYIAKSHQSGPLNIRRYLLGKSNAINKTLN